MGSQFSHFGRVHRPPRSPDALALRTRQCQAGAHPLADELALELGDRGEDAEDESAVGCGSIYALMNRDKLDSERIEFTQCVYQLAQAAGETVVAVDHDCVNLAPTADCQQAIELGPALA